MPLKLFAAVPSHSGTMVIPAVQTILDAQSAVVSQGGAFWFKYHGGAVISQVRNGLVGEFLQSDADLLLMLDADQAVAPGTLERMIGLDKPVVGCIYPKRRYDWNGLSGFSNTLSPDDIPKAALDWVGMLQPDDEHGRVSVVDGFARALHVGTGVFLVKRETFQQMMSHYPELEGLGFGTDLYSHLQHNWGFFNPVVREDGLPLSEDISFCLRWRQMGGEIWADVVSEVEHVGLHSFSGNYLGWDRLRQTIRAG